MDESKVIKKKKILVIAPNNWSAQELEKYRKHYDFIFVEDQFQKKGLSLFYRLKLMFGINFDKIVKKIASMAQSHKVDGILGADDFISCVIASQACNLLGLPGAVTGLELTFQHKYYSRLLQRKFVPDAVPKFELFNFKKPPQIPFFAKPIRGSASVMATRIKNTEELNAYRTMTFFTWLTFNRFIAVFQGMAKQVAGLQPVQEMAVAEEIIEGQQFTLEGFSYDGKTYIVGITDSIMYPQSKISFARFNFPSHLPQKIQNRMESIATLLMQQSGFSFGFFNIEFFYNEKTDDIKIIEVNPRMAFQFTDLYEKVLGLNTFELLLKMTVGDDISNEISLLDKRSGKYNRSSSFVIRSFEDAQVLSMPSEEEIKDLLKKFPDSRVMTQAQKGQILSTDIFQDVESYRLATINVGGNSEHELDQRHIEIKNALNIQIRKIPSQKSKVTATQKAEA